MDTKKKGLLVSWRPLQGFGRVVLGHRTYFIHATQIVKAPEQIVVGQVVYFNIAPPTKPGQNERAVDCVIEDAGGVA